MQQRMMDRAKNKHRRVNAMRLMEENTSAFGNLLTFDGAELDALLRTWILELLCCLLCARATHYMGCIHFASCLLNPLLTTPVMIAGLLWQTAPGLHSAVLSTF